MKLLLTFAALLIIGLAATAAGVSPIITIAAAVGCEVLINLRQPGTRADQLRARRAHIGKRHT